MSRTLRTVRPAALIAVLAAILAACGTDDGATDTAADPATGIAFDGTHVEAAVFQEAVDQPGVVVIDVRTPEEFAQAHLPGAVNINVEAPDFAEQVAALDLNAPYAVYCRSANRSQVALAIMADAGHSQTLGLAGGIVAWSGDIVTG